MELTQEFVDETVEAVIERCNDRTESYHGQYPNESVVPIAYYVEELSGTGEIHDLTSDWQNNAPSVVKQLFTKQSFQPDVVYPRGTVLLWNNNHMAIVLYSNGSPAVEVFEQNGDGSGAVCGVTLRPIDTEYYTCSYALVPILTGVPAVEPVKPVTYRTNTVDGITYTAFDKPTRYYVTRLEGTEKRSFSNVHTWRDFTPLETRAHGTEVICIGQAWHPIAPKGTTFYLTPEDWGAFRQTGVPDKLAGFSPDDLGTVKPAPQVLATLSPPLTDVVVTPLQPIPVVEPPVRKIQDIARVAAPAAWVETYKPFSASHLPDTYVVLRETKVTDFSGKYGPVTAGPDTKLPTLKLYGTFWIDGSCYGRAKPPGDVKFETWYGVLLYDPITNEPIAIDEADTIDTSTTYEEKKALKTAKFRHHVQYASSTIEKRAESLLNRFKYKK